MPTIEQWLIFSIQIKRIRKILLMDGLVRTKTGKKYKLNLRTMFALCGWRWALIQDKI
jgi:hypothetical protein